MTDSADDLANLAVSLNHANTAETVTVEPQSLAQRLWESLANMPSPEEAKLFTGFDGIEQKGQQ